MTSSKAGRHPDLSVVNPDATAIHIGSTVHTAAVSPDADKHLERSLGTFPQGLHDLAASFRSCGVISVTMESTGVYGTPAFAILEQNGFEVILLNACHA